MYNKEEALIRIKKLQGYFETGKIKSLHQHEVHPNLPKDSRLNYLYFTLPVPINFQRNSQAMWASALKTFEDPETNYLFYPEKVVLKSREEVQRDMVKHKLALQKNRHSDIWIRLCVTLNKYYENDPRNIFKQTQNCVSRIKNLLQITNKKDFPYLSGIKMANYWLYILNQFTDIKLRNKHKISIIPDTHIIQSTIKLGFAEDKAKPEEVEKIWFDLLEGTQINPVDMHSVLWNWSRGKFLPEV